LGVGFQVHSSKSYLRKEIDAGKDVALKIVFFEFDGIQAKQKAVARFFLELSYSFFFAY